PRHPRSRAGGARRRAAGPSRRARGREHAARGRRQRGGAEVIFVLRMAVRETRASWKRLLFFFICIAVGVAAIVTLRSVIQSVRDVFGSEAKGLLAADVLIATNREWPPASRATIDRRLLEAGSTARTETIETPTMVRPADRSKPVAKMVELRAVQPEYPLYGALVLQGADRYSYALLRDHG